VPGNPRVPEKSEKKKKNEKSIEKYRFKTFWGVIFGGTLDGFKQAEL